MKKLLALLGVATLGASLSCVSANAQVIRNTDLIGNGGNYGAPQGFAPHLFLQPMIFNMGGHSSFQLSGDFAIGGTYARANDLNQYGGFVEGTVGGTIRQTSPQGWTFGATVSATGDATYAYDVADPFAVNITTDNIEAYAFVDSPTLDVMAGRFSPDGIETNGEATLNEVIDSTEADFSSAVGGNLAGSLGTRQGPWEVIAAADLDNRQYGGVVWRRPVRTVTPAYGVEVIRDGNFDFANTPLTGGLATGEGQLYGGKAGAMMEYGRLTFGASAGLEAFYDGTTRIETQSIYDVGISNKSGRYIYGVSGQHRRSHDENISSSSVTTDMVIAISTGVDLELGYQFSRLEDDTLTEPVHSHAGKADIRLSF